MIPEDLGIRLFIWKHLTVVHRILQRLQNVNTTVSAKKFILATPDATIVGHKCTSEGRVPHEATIQKIRDWPECENLTQVSPAERLYSLYINTSVIAIGFIMSQEGEDGKRYPNHFGSISLTSIESRYSQAKLELYRLFRSLRAVWVFIFGVTNLVVEMDAKYVKGVINNPDLQPNVTINRWITGILLFHFELCYISADQHTGPDRLSCRPPSDDDPPDTDDFEDWLDNSYSFCITLLNDQLLPSSTTPCSIHLGFRFPCLPPSVPSALGRFLLLPIPPPIFVQSYSFVLHSSTSEPVAEPDSPTIPLPTKAIAREARICLI